MRKILCTLLFTLSVCSYAIVYASGVQQELAENLLRFHIIANSDSREDQEIKLKVRDFVSKGLADSTLSPHSAEYVRKTEELANAYLAKSGVEYRASASTERVYIPKKSYKNITLPSGRYNAIRLTLGNGEGENWWCVAYPALCFSESFSGELSEDASSLLKESISEESYSLITDDVEYRLFIVDFVGKVMGRQK